MIPFPPQESEEKKKYRKSYGHYPARVLADTIFRTRENLRYCKEHGIHLNGPKLGKPFTDPEEAKRHRKLEWLESGERGEIERNFGVGKRRYSLDCIVTKLKKTSEVMIHSIVVYMNLRKKLRLLLRSFFSWLQIAIQNWLEKVVSPLASKMVFVQATLVTWTYVGVIKPKATPHRGQAKNNGACRFVI